MKSFRSELEDLNNPIVEKDILDLANKIEEFHNGKIDGEKFRSLRLARGVYGQRQPGVQMIRIKVPYGKLTVAKLNKICDVADEYATQKIHLTTRQDIQIHYVSLDRTPELWAELEKEEVTLREACGNTVRNITGSINAGIDPDEPFDVTPYAEACFQYLLRNSPGQDLGRKFKISFSSSNQDTAFSFMHDLGLIPKIKDGVRGFKVMLGGGLGSQAIHALLAFDFLPTNELIPFTDAAIRVFDRNGERSSRQKARLKFLLKKMGLEEFMRLVKIEMKTLENQTIEIDGVDQPIPNVALVTEEVTLSDEKLYEDWFRTNVKKQKQDGFNSVSIKVSLGNLTTETSRKLGDIVTKFADDDFRISVGQGFLLRFVPDANLKSVFNALNELELATPGFNSIMDITTCPGTDTCNLGIGSSYGMATELERVIKEEYYDLIFDTKLTIKISGCMNACGQHTIANIGLHGSSFKNNNVVIPAMMLLLGGGVELDGQGSIADKVIKVPSRRVPDAVRFLLDDFEKNANDGEYFNDYYQRKEKNYFYELLLPLANLETIQEHELFDWRSKDKFKMEIGVGECAGVIIDLVSTLLYEGDEKHHWAKEALEAGQFADAIYHSYSVFIQGAKASLLSKDVKCNTHTGIIKDFNDHFVSTGEITMSSDFETAVLRINQNEPTESFAKEYLEEANAFLTQVKDMSAREKATV
ncbi:MAG: HEPN domain-containing protein [Flavobacteriales bacterium]|nr:HEPN domain-containing protein [Flavobacteriales bacterium]